MNDDQTIILIESINLNPNLSPTQKLDLVRKTMSDCREKQIGKIIVDAISKKRGPYKKKTIGDVEEKRGRGRPRKELSVNAQKMIQISRDADLADGRIRHE